MYHLINKLEEVLGILPTLVNYNVKLNASPAGIKLMFQALNS